MSFFESPIVLHFFFVLYVNVEVLLEEKESQINTIKKFLKFFSSYLLFSETFHIVCDNKFKKLKLYEKNSKK